MKWQISGIALVGILAAAGVSFIVLNTQPETTTHLIRSLFFISVGVLLWSVVTLIGYGFLRLRNRTTQEPRESLRRGSIIGFVTAITAILLLVIYRFL